MAKVEISENKVLQKAQESPEALEILSDLFPVLFIEDAVTIEDGVIKMGQDEIVLETRKRGNLKYESLLLDEGFIFKVRTDNRDKQVLKIERKVFE